MKRILTLFLCSLVFPLAVQAQSQRTFVASTGSDANPCSRVSPCRNFAAAVTATAPGGEVIVLDSAGYGPVTLTTSISLIAPAGVYAGISVFTGDGIAVNVPGGAVALRGLTINDLGGVVGINVSGVTDLDVDHCFITGFEPTPSTGAGLYVTAAGSRVNVDSCVALRDNDGFWFDDGVTAHVSHTRADNGLSIGFYAAGPTLGTTVTIADSSASNNGYAGVYIAGAGATVTILNSLFDGNHNVGIFNGGTAAVSGSTASSSQFGITNTGTTYSLGNNTFVNNSTANVNGTLTPVALK